jgi:predicted DNA-binding WGR domain protein
MHSYLEFTDDKSSKFWEINQEGSSFTVRYGKIDTNGQTQTREFASEEEAFKEAEKLLKEKFKKGYVTSNSKTKINISSDNKPKPSDIKKLLLKMKKLFLPYEFTYKEKKWWKELTGGKKHIEMYFEEYSSIYIQFDNSDSKDEVQHLADEISVILNEMLSLDIDYVVYFLVFFYQMKIYRFLAKSFKMLRMKERLDLISVCAGISLNYYFEKYRKTDGTEEEKIILPFKTIINNDLLSCFIRIFGNGDIKYFPKKDELWKYLEDPEVIKLFSGKENRFILDSIENTKPNELTAHSFCNYLNAFANGNKTANILRKFIFKYYPEMMMIAICINYGYKRKDIDKIASFLEKDDLSLLDSLHPELEDYKCSDFAQALLINKDITHYLKFERLFSKIGIGRTWILTLEQINKVFGSIPNMLVRAGLPLTDYVAHESEFIFCFGFASWWMEELRKLYENYQNEFIEVSEYLSVKSYDILDKIELYKAGYKIAINKQDQAVMCSYLILMGKEKEYYKEMIEESIMKVAKAVCSHYTDLEASVIFHDDDRQSCNKQLTDYEIDRYVNWLIGISVLFSGRCNTALKAFRLAAWIDPKHLWSNQIYMVSAFSDEMKNRVRLLTDAEAAAIIYDVNSPRLDEFISKVISLSDSEDLRYRIIAIKDHFKKKYGKDPFEYDKQ